VQVTGLGEETAAVTGGVSAGDRIVVLGAHLLQEGEQVRVADSNNPARVATSGGERQ
jgi:hypothetical protein